MKILFITSTPLEYSSSANLRNLSLIKGLIENGHSISTYSTKPERSSSFYDPTLIEGISFTKRYFTDLGVVHKNMTTKNESSIIKKKIKKFMINAYTSVQMYDPRKNEANRIPSDLLDISFDLIISSSDPKSSHLFAENLIDKNKKITNRWIQYWGDPFSGDINTKYKLSKKNIEKEEYRLLKLCDKAVYVSPFTSEMIFDKYPSLENIEFIPVPYKKERIFNNTTKDFTVSYVGDYYTSDRNLYPFIEASRQISDTVNIIGNSDITFEATININVSGRVEKVKAEEIEDNSDILICLLNKSGTQIPGKIYHYSATNKPILVILDGEQQHRIKDYFGKDDRYYFVQNNKDDIVKNINVIKNDIKNGKIFTPNKLFGSKEIAVEFVK